MHTTKLYFEVHVTLDPQFDDKLSQLKALAIMFRFRVADLVMKRSVGSEAPNQEDSFCTYRGNDWDETVRQTTAFIAILQDADFVVRRYKIENTLIDSKMGDELYLL